MILNTILRSHLAIYFEVIKACIQAKKLPYTMTGHFGINCYCKIIHSFCQRNCLKIHVIIDELRDGYKPAALTTLTPYQIPQKFSLYYNLSLSS